MGSEPVRLSLVGAGRMGRVHLGALRNAHAIELAGVVEPVDGIRAKLRDEGLQVYASVNQMLDTDRPEGVLIAAPSDQHTALVASFACAGIPMLCEKPLGVQTEDSIEAVRAAREAGVLLQVGYWRRFVPELENLRERIRAGQFGEISQLSCMQWDAESPSEQFRAHSGGIAVDMGVHEFDQTRWLLGQEFDWVTGAPAGPNSVSRDGTDPDAATLLAGLSDGAAVTISLGRHFPHEDSCWLEIWGTAGYDRIAFMWGNTGQEVFRSSIRRQVESFGRAVRSGKLEGASGSDAVAALVVAGLATESLAASGTLARHASTVIP
jgi:myo-inositol 2-dehydrogenase/D-chiro-inositol 1-dehydrogenase